MNNPRRVALISGASAETGAAAARELGDNHIVVNADCDVCDQDQVAALFDRIRREHGRVDVLVCDAGTGHPPFEPLDALSWNTFAHQLKGELSGVFFLTEQALSLMRAQRSGRIVYLSSSGADAAQSTAKAALTIFSRHVAAEAARYGVTVKITPRE